MSCALEAHASTVSKRRGPQSIFFQFSSAQFEFSKKVRYSIPCTSRERLLDLLEGGEARVAVLLAEARRDDDAHPGRAAGHLVGVRVRVRVRVRVSLNLGHHREDDG